MSVIANFSKQIYLSRKKMGITQETAAEALGISVRWYQDVENGKHLCSLELALKIIAFYGISGESLRETERVLVSSL